MDTAPPAGSGSDPEASPPRDVTATRPGELQLRRLARRRARRGPDAPQDAYDAANEKGVQGEQLVGADLERMLASSQCLIVNSLRFLGLGDIDHLVVGPGGITVIDAKNWSGTVTVRGLVPSVAGWAKHNEVRKLQRQIAGVRLALLHARPELRNVGVRGVMCLAAEPGRAPTALEDRLVLAGSIAAAEIANRLGALSAAAIAHLHDVLVQRVPRVTSGELAELYGALPASLDPELPSLSSPPRRRVQRRRTTAPRTRRSHRARGTAVSSALFSILVAAVAWWGITHVRLVVPHPTATVSQLSLRQRNRHLVVRFLATAGSVVHLTIRGAGRPHRVTLRATGTPQLWPGPSVSPTAPRIQVQACAVIGGARCDGGRSSVLLHRRNRQRAPAKWRSRA